MCVLQVGVLFTFLARQMVRQGDDIFVNRALFEQVVEALCLCDSGHQGDVSLDLEHEERQQALLDLYAADGLQHFDEHRLIQLATSAAFYRVCEVVYARRGHFHEIVACYWRDPARRHLTFNYVQSLIADRTVSTLDLDKLRTAVIGAVSELVRIDARRTAKLLLVTLGVTADQVLQQLDDDEAVFEFLSGVFDYVSSVPDIQSSLEPAVSERYVDVMCRLGRPSSEIVSFLRSTCGYRLTEMLDICRQHSVSDAVVCLLEKSGDVRSAFDILFERVTLVTSDAVQTHDDHHHDVEVRLECSVTDIIGLLQRGSRQLEQTELETVWFMLLDFLMDTMKLVKSTSVQGDDGTVGGLVNGTVGGLVKTMTRQVINAMMAHVPLPSVLQRIVANEGGVAGHFGDVRDLLSGVLDACSYERTLLSTCARLVNQDVHRAVASLTTASRRAAAPHSDMCVVCGRTALGPSVAMSRHSDDVVCFHCGHLTHRACLLDTVTSPVTSQSHDVTERRWKCPVCCRSSSSSSDRQPTAPPARSPSHCPPATSVRQLEALHIDSVDRLRAASRSPSRLTVLGELAQLEHTRPSSTLGHPRSKGSLHSSILHNEQFALRLAVPRPGSC